MRQPKCSENFQNRTDAPTRTTTTTSLAQNHKASEAQQLINLTNNLTAQHVQDAKEEGPDHVAERVPPGQHTSLE